MPTPEELNKTGMEHYKAGRWPEAIAAYEEAVTARPEFAPCWVNLAFAYNKRGKPDDAVRAAQRAVAIAPQAAAAHACLGTAQAAKGRWNEAVSEYVRAFELDKAQFGGLATAGHLCMDHGITAKAVELWTTFLATAPPEHPRRAEIEEQLKDAGGGPGLISKF
jgi:tetratricopeptide (TPR) repeat protein